MTDYPHTDLGTYDLALAAYVLRPRSEWTLVPEFAPYPYGWSYAEHRPFTHAEHEAGPSDPYLRRRLQEAGLLPE